MVSYVDDSKTNKTERNVTARNMAAIPAKLRATIRFAYEESAKNKMGANADAWIQDTMVHTRAHYRHPSLGTEIEFEVR